MRTFRFTISFLFLVFLGYGISVAQTHTNHTKNTTFSKDYNDCKWTYHYYYDDNDKEVRHGAMTINGSENHRNSWGGTTIWSFLLNTNYVDGKLNGTYTEKISNHTTGVTTNGGITDIDKYNWSITANFNKGIPTGTWKYIGSGLARDLWNLSRIQRDYNVNFTYTFKNGKLSNFVTNVYGGVNVSLKYGNNNGYSYYDIISGTNNGCKIEKGIVTNKFYRLTGELSNVEATQTTIIKKFLANPNYNSVNEGYILIYEKSTFDFSDEFNDTELSYLAGQMTWDKDFDCWAKYLKKIELSSYDDVKAVVEENLQSYKYLSEIDNFIEDLNRTNTIKYGYSGKKYVKNETIDKIVELADIRKKEIKERDRPFIGQQRRNLKKYLDFVIETNASNSLANSLQTIEESEYSKLLYESFNGESRPCNIRYWGYYYPMTSYQIISSRRVNETDVLFDVAIQSGTGLVDTSNLLVNDEKIWLYFTDENQKNNMLAETELNFYKEIISNKLNLYTEKSKELKLSQFKNFLTEQSVEGVDLWCYLYPIVGHKFVNAKEIKDNASKKFECICEIERLKDTLTKETEKIAVSLFLDSTENLHCNADQTTLDKYSKEVENRLYMEKQTAFANTFVTSILKCQATNYWTTKDALIASVGESESFYWNYFYPIKDCKITGSTQTNDGVQFTCDILKNGSDSVETYKTTLFADNNGTVSHLATNVDSTYTNTLKKYEDEYIRSRESSVKDFMDDIKIATAKSTILECKEYIETKYGYDSYKIWGYFYPKADYTISKERKDEVLTFTCNVTKDSENNIVKFQVGLDGKINRVSDAQQDTKYEKAVLETETEYIMDILQKEITEQKFNDANSVCKAGFDLIQSIHSTKFSDAYASNAQKWDELFSYSKSKVLIANISSISDLVSYTITPVEESEDEFNSQAVLNLGKDANKAKLYDCKVSLTNFNYPAITNEEVLSLVKKNTPLNDIRIYYTNQIVKPKINADKSFNKKNILKR